MDYIVDAWFRTGRQETLSPVVRDLVTVARDKFVHALSPLAANQSITGYGAIKDGHLNNPNPMLQPVDLPAGAWEMVSTRLHRTVTMCEERVGALWLGHPGESSKPQCSYSIAIDRANLIQLHRLAYAMLISESLPVPISLGAQFKNSSLRPASMVQIDGQDHQ